MSYVVLNVQNELDNSPNREFGNISAINADTFQSFGGDDDMGVGYGQDNILDNEASVVAPMDIDDIAHPDDNNLGIDVPSVIEFDNLDEQPEHQVTGMSSNTTKAFTFISDALTESQSEKVNFNQLTVDAKVIL